MTITEVQRIIHRKYARDTSYPTTSSEDFIYRMELINNSINIWEMDEGQVWRELFTTETGTLATGDDDYALSDNFLVPAGHLRVYDSNGIPTFYTYVDPQSDAWNERFSSGTKYYWITGGDQNKVLNMNPTPTSAENGLTYKLDYYKQATKFTTGEETSDIEMSDPYFVVYNTLSQMYVDDENFTKASIQQQLADQKMNSMRTRNDILPPNHQDQMESPFFSGFGN